MFISNGILCISKGATRNFAGSKDNHPSMKKPYSITICEQVGLISLAGLIGGASVFLFVIANDWRHSDVKDLISYVKLLEIVVAPFATLIAICIAFVRIFNIFHNK